MSYPASEVSYCGHCGAPNPATDSKCWICHRELGGKVSGPSAPPVRLPQFALSTLLLVITLICISLGLATIAPGLIIPLVLVVVPALVRTVYAAEHLSGRKRGLTTFDRIGVFVTSMGIVIAIWVAGGITFFAACAAAVGAIPFSDTDGFLVWGIAITGGFAALVLVVFLFKKTWPS